MISVIIPLYNSEKTIGKTLRTVLSQSYDNFEIIVVNDGSTDNGVNIAEGFKSSKIRIFSQKNAGVSAARNNGVSHAKGDIVAFLDADDLWLPNHLEAIDKLSKKYPEAGFFGSVYEEVLYNGIGISVHLGRIENIMFQEYFEYAMHYPVFAAMSSTAVKKAAFEDIGGFMQGLAMGEDIDLWTRLAIRYKMAFNNSITVRHIKAVDGQATGSSAGTLRQIKFQAIESIYNYLNNSEPMSDRKLILMKFAHSLFYYKAKILMKTPYNDWTYFYSQNHGDFFAPEFKKYCKNKLLMGIFKMRFFVDRCMSCLRIRMLFRKNIRTGKFISTISFKNNN